MTIQERSVDSVVLLDLGGRLVLGEDHILKERVSSLLTSGSKQLVLNLADVSYVDSSGLGALVGSCLNARSQGGAVKLLRPSKRVLDLLSMARLLTVFDIFSSEHEALLSFGAGA
jgi:anti-sigma B factor antagonist